MAETEDESGHLLQSINQIESEEEEEVVDESNLNKWRFRFTDFRLFLVKTAVVVVASYAFIPLILLHNKGEITALVFALILVGLHLAFIVIYLYKVKFRELDPDWRSLSFRILGLCACLGLLILVAEFLADRIWVLSLELLGLCAVHTLILSFLMIEVRRPGQPWDLKKVAPDTNEEEA